MNDCFGAVEVFSRLCLIGIDFSPPKSTLGSRSSITCSNLPYVTSSYPTFPHWAGSNPLTLVGEIFTLLLLQILSV